MSCFWEFQGTPHRERAVANGPKPMPLAPLPANIRDSPGPSKIRDPLGSPDSSQIRCPGHPVSVTRAGVRGSETHTNLESSRLCSFAFKHASCYAEEMTAKALDLAITK